MSPKPYVMQFDIATIKHLGLQMYSTLPPVIAELVSNAWDADAKRVEIDIPTEAITAKSQIVVTDNGCGMSDRNLRDSYLIIGRDRRAMEGDNGTPVHGRRLMGRKGIGKLSAFGIATEIEVESAKAGQISRFKMDYDEIEKAAVRHEIQMPPLKPTGEVKHGTRIILRNFKKYKSRKINIQDVRRRLARRFSVIGPSYKFQVLVNGKEITPQERDLKRLLDKGADGKPYLWEYSDAEIKPGTGWTVSGWIGALDRTSAIDDGIQRGVTLLARGKVVQDPFVFEAVVGQQYALSYLIGELHAEFVDEGEDTISTTRNSLVWDTEANSALMEWGKEQVNRIAREWAERRSKDNESELTKNALYQRFLVESERFEDNRVRKAADRLIKSVVAANPLLDATRHESVIQYCIDYVEFDAFKELADEIAAADEITPTELIALFREWELVEAREMMRVTEGRITTIEKLQDLINTNALEVPTLHQFLKEFPWVLDPRWNLIADEVTFSKLLNKQFPEGSNVPEGDRRIDFLCVKESSNLIVVEIKRPRSKASIKELNQIEEYVAFMRDHVRKTTDESLHYSNVVGYLLCGDMVDTPHARGKRENLEKAGIYIRTYRDLLSMVEANHKDFLKKYSQLRKARQKNKK
jgi:hypothetical protein